MNAEWPVSREELESEKARIQEEFGDYHELRDLGFDKVELKHGKWNCVVIVSAFNGEHPFQELEVYDWYKYYIFAYDEENMRVRYIASEGQDHFGDPPYFLSLDW